MRDERNFLSVDRNDGYMGAQRCQNLSHCTLWIHTFYCL